MVECWCGGGSGGGAGWNKNYICNKKTQMYSIVHIYEYMFMYMPVKLTMSSYIDRIDRMGGYIHRIEQNENLKKKSLK